MKSHAITLIALSTIVRTVGGMGEEVATEALLGPVGAYWQAPPQRD